MFKLLCGIPSKLPCVVWTNFQKRIPVHLKLNQVTFTWMVESKHFNWIRNKGSLDLKTRQVKTNQHFSVKQSTLVKHFLPQPLNCADATSFRLSTLFLYQCLQRIIVLLMLLNMPMCYQFKLVQTHIFKCTCQHKNSKSEVHTSKHKLRKRADKNQHFF